LSCRAGDSRIIPLHDSATEAASSHRCYILLYDPSISSFPSSFTPNIAGRATEGLHQFLKHRLPITAGLPSTPLLPQRVLFLWSLRRHASLYLSIFHPFLRNTPRIVQAHISCLSCRLISTLPSASCSVCSWRFGTCQFSPRKKQTKGAISARRINGWND
jgi:hypothetical protein